MDMGWDGTGAGPVYSVACSPTDTGLVATGGGDDVAFIWRVGDAESHKQLRGKESVPRLFKLNLSVFLFRKGIVQ